MKNKVDLLSGPIDTSLRVFAFPLAISFVVHMLYAWVDTFYVSRLGPSSIAAIGISEQLIFFIFTLGGGFAIGSGIVVARKVGEGNQHKADLTATQAIVMMFLYSSFLAIFLYLMTDPVLSMMNVEGELAALSAAYLNAVVIGVPANYLIFQINAIVRSSGNSMFPMYMLLLGTVLNAILSPLLIFGPWIFPRLEMFGAGLATALAQILTVIVSIIALRRGYTPISITFKGFRFEWNIVKTIVRISIPTSLQFLSVSVNRLLLFTIANTFGTTVVAAYTLGLKVDLFVFMSIFAVGAAIEIVSGQNMGAGQYERIFQYHRSAVKQLSWLMAFLGTAVFFGGEYFSMIFTTEQVIIDETVKYFRITAFSYIPFAVGIVSTRVISGAGDTLRSLRIVATILLLIQLPMAYILSMFTSLDQTGIWISILTSQVLFAFFGLYSLFQKKWMSVKI
jgi:putative MATE family efflux protein